MSGGEGRPGRHGEARGGAWDSPRRNGSWPSTRRSLALLEGRLVRGRGLDAGAPELGRARPELERRGLLRAAALPPAPRAGQAGRGGGARAPGGRGVPDLSDLALRARADADRARAHDGGAAGARRARRGRIRAGALRRVAARQPRAPGGGGELPETPANVPPRSTSCCSPTAIGSRSPTPRSAPGRWPGTSVSPPGRWSAGRTPSVTSRPRSS